MIDPVPCEICGGTSDCPGMETHLETMHQQSMKSGKQLESFIEYCKEHPDERFWQALRNWSGNNFIFTADALDQNNFQPMNLHDTFYDT